MPKLTEKQKEEISLYYKTVVTQEVANRSDLRDKIKEYWARHFGEYSAKTDKDVPFVGAADTQTGVIKINDAVLEARFYTALNILKFCGIMSNASKEANEAAKRIEGFMNNHWKQKSGVITTLADAFQYLVVEGTMFLDIVPDNVKKKKKKKYKYGVLENTINKIKGYFSDGAGNLQTEDVPVTNFIGAKWKNRPSLKIMYDNSATNIQDCSWIALPFSLTPSEILAKEKNEGWYNVDKIIDKSKLNILPEVKTDTTLNENEEKNDYQGFQDTYSNKKDFYQVWCRYDIGNKGELNNLLLIFDAKDFVLMNDEQDPLFPNTEGIGRYPIVSSPFYRIAGKIQGQGQPQRLAALNDEYDIIHDQAIDNNTRTNSFSGTGIPQKGLDYDKLKISLGKIIPVQSNDAIKFFEFKGGLQGLEFIGNAVWNLIERTSLVSDYSMGRESSVNNNPTARGTAMILREMSMNLGPMMQNLQIALVDAVKQTLDCMYEFMPSEGIKYIKTGNVVDEQGNPKETAEEVTVSREDLEYRDNFEITVLSGAVDVMLDAERQAAIMALQMFGADQSGEINTSVLKKNALETIVPRLAKEAWRSPQEVQMLKMIQQKAMELQQREQMIMQTEQTLVQVRDQMIGEHASLEEEKFVHDMERQGVPPERQQELIAQFRQQFINRKMAEKNGNQVPEAMPPQPPQAQPERPPVPQEMPNV